MLITKELLPGTLDMLILKAVSLGPNHGYGILLRIEETVYPPGLAAVLEVPVGTGGVGHGRLPGRELVEQPVKNFPGVDRNDLTMRHTDLRKRPAHGPLIECCQILTVFQQQQALQS